MCESRLTKVSATQMPSASTKRPQQYTVTTLRRSTDRICVKALMVVTVAQTVAMQN